MVEGVVFQPANGCSESRSLVEIIFLMLKQTFLSIYVIKCCMCLHIFERFPFFLYFVLLVTEKVIFASKIVFDQQMACGAPVRWSKNTSMRQTIFMSKSIIVQWKPWKWNKKNMWIGIYVIKTDTSVLCSPSFIPSILQEKKVHWWKCTTVVFVLQQN